MGLKVVAGIWLEHMRHDEDYDYNDDEFINKQREKVVSLLKNLRIILLFLLGDLEMKLSYMFQMIC